MKIFDLRYEAMPRNELEQLQLERLQALLTRLKRNVRRYREKLGDLRVESLADLARLPFTTGEELTESFPYGMFAFPLREVIRLHTIVGAKGSPVVIGYTRNDLQQWGRLVARQLLAGGVTANDVLQICLGGTSQAGASGFGLGAEQLEASVIAEDPTHVDFQLAMLGNYRPTILITTPSNAWELIRLMEKRRLNAQSLNLRTVLLSRPVDQTERAAIGAGLFSTVRCNFGLAEILDPGLCVECEQGRFHVHEDHFLPEICEGELVITTLYREAMPLLRYRTRIACELSREKCACGRTGAIIKPGARLDGCLRVSEESLYENQIADVLAQTRVAGHKFSYSITERHVVVHIELSEGLFGDTIWFMQKLQNDIEAEFLTRLGIMAEVRFKNPPSQGQDD